jgi:hypothetical protein
LHRGLSVRTGLPFAGSPQSEEIEQWHGKRRRPGCFVLP